LNNGSILYRLEKVKRKNMNGILILLLLIVYSDAFIRFKSNIFHIKVLSTISPTDVNVLPDSKRKLAEVSEKVKTIMTQDSMNVQRLKQSIRDMEEESSQSKFWDDAQRAQSLLGELNRIKAMVERIEKWKTTCEDVEMLLDLISTSEKVEGSYNLLYK
jgi:hypothetical protein